MVIGLVGLASGTFAYFQDQATGAAQITAGKVDLKASGQDYLGDIYLPHLVPGDSGYMNLGSVQNVGNSKGELFLTITHADGTALENQDLTLYFVANGQIKYVNLANGATDVDLGQMAAGGSMPMSLYFNYADTGNLQAGMGATHTYGITLSLRSVGTAGQDINVANNYYQNN